MDPLRIPSKGTAHSNKLSILARVWPSIVAGLAGSVAHSSLMFLKSWAGFLPLFQPYDDLQRALSDLIGSSVHPAVSWVLSFANGALILGFLFARTYRLLPGRNGAVKGLVFGVLGWIAMGLLFFPLLGRGLFATQAGLGLLPSVFSLLMVLTPTASHWASCTPYYVQSELLDLEEKLGKVPHDVRGGHPPEHRVRTLRKALCAVMTFAGMASFWGAIAADVGASLLVVGNALRLLRYRIYISERNDAADRVDFNDGVGRRRMT